MNQSKYNFIINKGNVTYWFNAISQCHFRIDSDLSLKLKSNLDFPENFKLNAPNFYNKLIDKGFLVDPSIDEINIIREKNRMTRESKSYFLIILPTLNCNFKCWYCIQDHIDTMMDEITVENVKRHIEKAIKIDKIESLQIEWFGGEPFLYFNEVVMPISRFANELCKDSNIPFTATSTTNGYYLSPSIHSKLTELNFQRFQITIDGTRDIHNAVKTSNNGDSAFDVTLNNINSLLTNTENITVLLRINYTDDNLKNDIIAEVNELVDKDNRNKIEIMFRRVWQEKVDKKRNEKIFSIADAFEEEGYCKNRFELDNGFLPCYSDKICYNAINYNGCVVKCTASDDLYSKNPPGLLNNEGEIVWKEGFLESFYKIRFENDHCIKCKYLPICMGNCGMDYKIETEDNFSCKSNGFDSSFEEIILHNIEKEYEK